MIPYADSSFTSALFREVKDQSAVAWAWVADHPNEIIYVSPLTHLEFCAAARQLRGRDEITIEEENDAREQYLAALSDGIIEKRDVRETQWFPEAHRQITLWSVEQHGHKSLDLLQVAAAKCIGADILLSFDANQRRLALNQQLEVFPPL